MNAFLRRLQHFNNTCKDFDQDIQSKILISRLQFHQIQALTIQFPSFDGIFKRLFDLKPIYINVSDTKGTLPLHIVHIS